MGCFPTKIPIYTWTWRYVLSGAPSLTLASAWFQPSGFETSTALSNSITYMGGRHTVSSLRIEEQF